ncbi:rcc01693 family protein [Rhodovulum sulfidophilum]|uniref:Phage tail assembly chaperone n=1 Tax=Rhodovulum sulfidophilum TaxID=35806 RepID=A0ABS1RR35_RHOSU|nr:rcc01693 family protein [Rhodovulum sulfidophilum]MBL3607685.1 phage tail assembly chaperone [Rhodovulum sulfidophilum]MCE8459178.1 phage tail assembly chaperone [Rhodovulum sulfidophilum]
MGFDWGTLMRVGIRGLGLRPAEFWALTPAELMLMLGADGGPAPMSRARLEELARAFPDKPRDEG